jgi:hypothetical protein
VEATTASGRRLAVVVAAAASGAAGFVHAAAAGTHAEERSVVLLFTAVAVAQMGLAVALWARPVRTVAVLVAGVNGAAVVAWLLSRTEGLPLIDAMRAPEAVGTQDLVAAMCAAIAVGAAVVMITQPIARHEAPQAYSLVVVFAALALAVPALAAGHTHDDHAHEEAAAGHVHGEVAHQDGDDHDHTDAAGAHGDDHADDHAAQPAATTDDGHDHGTPGTLPTTGGHNHATTPGTTPHQHGTGPGEVPHEHPGTPPTTTPGTPHTHVPTPTGPIISVDDPRLSPAQRRAATELIYRTAAYLNSNLSTVAAVEAAGYRSIGDGGTNGYEHFVNFGYLSDGTEMDPSRIESVVAKKNGDGTKTVVSGMYILSLGKTMGDVPDIAGELTTWHDHQNLCWEGTRVVGITENGQCRRGTFIATPPMLHVWLVSHPCGPFAGIETSGHGTGCGSHQH